MKILTEWLRSYLPVLDVDDAQLAEDLTLRGIAVEGVLRLGDQQLNHLTGDSKAALFDMDITTNRVDAMSHYGIAREAAAIYNLPLLPLIPLDTTLPPAVPSAPPFPVRIDPSAAALCGRFTARILRGVHIAPTQGRIGHFFTQLGQKQISNAVDVSNFVLLGMGQPTHAFDLDKIEGGILVRPAHPGEQLRLLDGTTRTLVSDDLVIADHVKALSLAGVMGGFDSMITPETTNILIEAAWFDPATIRATSRRHLLHTDASHRFERGADFNAPPVASDLVAKHILEACGGRLDGDLIDLIHPATAAQTAARPPIQLSLHEVRRHLGRTLAPEGITAPLVLQYLTALGCTLTATGPTTFSVTLPSWRLDLTREIDLIEEVARVYGYNRFANTLPTPLPVLVHPTARAEAAVRSRLLALGFSESISSTFAGPADSDVFFTPQLDTGSSIPARPVPLENPLSLEASLLRPSLIPGMLTMLAHNLNRDVPTVRLFEQGQIFTTPSAPGPKAPLERVEEAASLALGLAGQSLATPLHPPGDAPFFELKAAIESLLSLFDAPALTFTPEAPAWLQPGRSATANLAAGSGTRPVARFGELAASQQHARKLRHPVYLAEIDLAFLYTLPLRHTIARDLSRFQAVQRDFSFTFPDTTPWQTIAGRLQALAIPELQRLTPIEIFRDAKGISVPPAHYALLLRATFQSPGRTLREEELSTWQSTIIETLTTLGGALRAGPETGN